MAESTKKTARKTAKKTAEKAAKSETKTSEPRFAIPGPVVDLQRRLLEGQRALFERTFDAVTTVQERQEDVVNERIAGSSVVPDPLTELAASWTESQRQIRSTYRQAVVKNYALLAEWVGAAAKGA